MDSACTVIILCILTLSRRYAKIFMDKVNFILEDSHENHQKKLDNQKLYFDGKQKERFLQLTKELLC